MAGRQTRLLWVFHLLMAFVLTVLPAHAAWPGRDGRIFFLAGDGFTPNIFSMTPEGTDLRQITFFNGVGLCCETLSPDARQIAFTEFPDNAPPQIWMVGADGSNPHQVLDDPDGATDRNPSFSPDGNTLYFSRCQDSCAIFQVRTDGTHLTQINPYQPEVFDETPVASPNGRTIAFDSFNRDGVIAAVYLMNSDGSNLRRLTPPGIEGVDADWSPDGTKLVFFSHCCNPQNPEIWSINADGTGLKRLTNPQTNIDLRPAYSPQGEAITFYRFFPVKNKSAIYILDLASQQERLIREMPPPVTGTSTTPQRPVFNHRNASGLRNMRDLRQIRWDAFQPKWGVADR